MTAKLDSILFDFGGVFIDWQPRDAFKGSQYSEQEVDDFFTKSPFWECNDRNDLGIPLANTLDYFERYSPEWIEMIRYFYEMEITTLDSNEVPETREFVIALKKAGLRAYGLSNWNSERFFIAKGIARAIQELDAYVLSADIGIVKPDLRLFRHAIDRFNLNPPERTLFVDDNAANCAASERTGLKSFKFELRGENNLAKLKEVLKDEYGVHV
ncbi:MAG: HAD-IA family hydrolase [Bifidobacteriaceae bacterium]|jgi:HAD superfamily hydrolase (TIGR01509 family)|nr:HAD-IA family hydrolase [Bifidobacteriaceae bacterium]